MVEQVLLARIGDVHAPHRDGDDLGAGGVDRGARLGEVAVLAGADDQARAVRLAAELEEIRPPCALSLRR